MLTPEQLKLAEAELLKFLEPCTEYNEHALEGLEFSHSESHVELDRQEISEINRDYGDQFNQVHIRIPLKWSSDESDADDCYLFLTTESNSVIGYRCYLPPYCDQDGDASLSDVAWYPSIKEAQLAIHAAIKQSLKDITGFIKQLNKAATTAGLDFQHSLLDAAMADTFENWSAK